jgi:lysophospholipase L1-like esterase
MSNIRFSSNPTGSTVNSNDLFVFTQNGVDMVLPFSVISSTTASNITTLTGGTYSNGTLTLKQSNGNNINVTGFNTSTGSTSGTSVTITGGTINYTNGTINLNKSDNTIVSINGLTDNYISGATYNNGTLTLLNNNNTQINVSGFTNSLSAYTTNITFNSYTASTVGIYEKSLPIQTIQTSGFTPSLNKFYPIDTTSVGSLPISLPSGATNGDRIGFKWVSGTTAPIGTCNGSDVIDVTGGLNTFTFSLLQQVKVFKYTNGVWLTIQDSNAVSQLDGRYVNKVVPTPTIGTDAINKNYSDANAGIPLQIETSTFVNRLKAKPNTYIDATVINAVDKFFVRAKRDGSLACVQWAWCPMGSTMVSAVVNLFAAVGVAAELTNNGFVDADFGPILGVGTGAATNSSNKFLGTGIIPNNYGITSRNVSFGANIPDNNVGDNYSLMSINGGGYSNYAPLIISHYPNGNAGISTEKNTDPTIFDYISPKPVLLGMSQTTGTNGTLMNRNGSTSIEDTPSGSAVSMLSEVTLFKGNFNSASTFYSKGNLNFAWIGSAMTKTQLQSWNLGILELLTAMGRISNVGGVGTFNGDSITIGQGASVKSNSYASITSRLLGFRENNISQGSAMMTIKFNGRVAGIVRYLDLAKFQQNTVINMWGTNDQISSDLTTNGDATIILDFKTKYTTVIQDQINKNLRSIVCIPPWNGTANIIKQRAYATATIGMCNSLGIPVYNALEDFNDTGSPTTYLNGDQTHPNDLGHLKIATGIVDLAQGRISRNLSLAFPAVSTVQDLTVMMGGAKVGQVANVTGVPVAGLEFKAWVSAADTVTVRATGTTAGVTTQFFRVTVLLD